MTAANDATDGLPRLEERLGWPFRDPQRLLDALAHRSWCAEHPDTESNERLEFLGDAVLGLVVTDRVFALYPDLPEGELAKVRAAVVNAEVLAELAVEVGLGAELLLGKGEDASGGRTKPSILSDAMEAVIAAVYLDGGWTAANELVLRLLAGRIAQAAAGPGGHDYKTRLQELAARRFDRLPRYQVTGHGPDHAKRFVATVMLDGEARGTGEGRSKKHAEQAAAKAAWLWLCALDGDEAEAWAEPGTPERSRPDELGDEAEAWAEPGTPERSRPDGHDNGQEGHGVGREHAPEGESDAGAA